MEKHFIFFISLIISIFNLNCHSQEIKNDSIKVNITNKFDLAYWIKNDTSCYKESGNVYLTTFDTSKTICFKNCFKPILSPDGKKLLISKLYPDSIHCVIVDLNTMQEQKYSLEYNYACKEAWSPDNNYLAFLSSFTQIGLAKSDNSSFSVLDFRTNMLINNPSWTSDGNYIMTGNASYIFLVGVKYNYVDTIFCVNQIVDSSFIGINGYSCLTFDSKYLIINAFVKEHIEGLVPPNASSIYIYDINSKKLTRITPIGLSTYDIELGLNNEVYFTGVTDYKNKIYGVYKVNIYNKKITKIIDHAYFSSCRIK